MELISECAKNNRASKSKYLKVWKALVSCTEAVLASGRGVLVEKLGTVTYISRSIREGAWMGHKGCVFVINPKFARTFSALQRETPQRSLLAPAVPVSSARIGYTAGVEHDYARVALAAIVDAIGRRVCSGSKLCLPFGRVGFLVAKDRRLGFQFAEGFRRPRLDPAAGQNKYDSDVRRILTAIDARREAGSTESLAGPAGPNPTRPETCPQPTADRPTARGGQAQTSKGGSTGRSNALRSGGKRRSSSSRGGGGGGGGGSRTASDPSLLSVRSSTRQPGAGGVARTRPVSVDDAAGGPAAARPRRGGAPASRGALHEGPETPTPRPMIAGSAAMVAGGRKTARNKAPQAAGLGKAVFAAGGRLDAGGGGVISPSTAKKVLPHFLAIGNPGSQALVPKEGAEIVQRQARERFARIKAANLLLDEKETDETKKRQHAKWKEYEQRHEDERKRLREYLAAVKEQAEAQKEAKRDEKSSEFMRDNPDPGRAYPCRTEYDLVKEQAWRKSWCADLEQQIELKQRLEGGARNAEASKDRVRAAQLDAAIKADRRREVMVKRLDMERINRDWATQVSSFAHPQGGGRRVQSIILDKIVR